jgi:hypothetical protein
MAKQHAQSLGNLLKRVQTLAIMDDRLKALIADAKARRDFLAHHFFRERAVEFNKRDGRDKMIAELSAARLVFEEVDTTLAATSSQPRRPVVIPAIHRVRSCDLSPLVT